jgi:outer membrane protein assembly factor BamB
MGSLARGLPSHRAIERERKRFPGKRRAVQPRQTDRAMQDVGRVVDMHTGLPYARGMATGVKSRGWPAFLLACLGVLAGGADWPRWRGGDGNAVADGFALPQAWSATENVRWSVEIPGEGSSSPIVVGERVYVTSSRESGRRRELLCLERETGQVRWRREVEDDDPEIASSLTGHAAATPAANADFVVAAFGRAGLFCWRSDGELQWRFELGRFDSELGLASSPILVDQSAILACDHDGNRFTSFDSYLVAVDLATGRQQWRTERPGLGRSWSTPLVVRAGDASLAETSLLVNGQDELRAYDARDGRLLWQVPGQTGWVAPSPVVAHELAFATSGKQGPVMAIRLRKADAGADRVAWRHENAGPYVCSPVAYRDWLFVHDEAGVLTCYDALSGRQLGRRRLEGKFHASSVAGDGKAYFTNDEGVTYVVAAGPRLEILAINRLDDTCLASPALADGSILLRTGRRLWRIDGPKP